MDATTRQLIADRFAVIGNLSQSKMPISAQSLTIETIPRNSLTVAEVSTTGSLLRINPSVFPNGEVEKRIATYLHELGHIGMGQTHHKPAFWKNVINICNTLFAEERSLRTVESLFNDSIDWHKVQYRLIQDVNDKNVDNRMETTYERQIKLANGLDKYTVETAKFFELHRYSWSSGDEDSMFYEDKYSESVDIESLPVSASDYSDAELKSFAEQEGTVVDNSHTTFTSPITYIWANQREFIDQQYAYKMSAFCDRYGMDYCPMTIAKAVTDDVVSVSTEVEEQCERIVQR